MKCIDRMQWYKTGAGGECVCGASISKVSGQEQCILQIYSYRKGTTSDLIVE